MTQLEYQRELAAFECNITLSEHEEAKAHERVTELKYMKARFNLDYITAVVQAQEQEKQQGQK